MPGSKRVQLAAKVDHFFTATDREANLHQADLRGADLKPWSWEYLSEEDTQEDLVEGSCDDDSCVFGTTFHGTDFRGADLRGLDLSESIGLTEEQISSAITDAYTTLPPLIKRKQTKG